MVAVLNYVAALVAHNKPNMLKSTTNLHFSFRELILKMYNFNLGSQFPSIQK